MSTDSSVVPSLLYHGLFFDIIKEPIKGYEVLRHPGAVAILPVKFAKYGWSADVLFCEQFRPAVGQNVIEIPAGTCDVEGEDPRQTAVRELVEEVGYYPEKIADLGVIFPSPGYSSEVIHLYAGTDLCKVDRDAEMEPMWVDLEQVPFLIENGRLVDSKTIAAICRFDQLGANMKWEPAPKFKG